MRATPHPPQILCTSAFQEIFCNLGGVLRKKTKNCQHVARYNEEVRKRVRKAVLRPSKITASMPLPYGSWRCLPRLVPIGLYPPKGCLLSLEGGGPFIDGRHLFHTKKASLSHNVDVSFTQKTAFVFLFLSHFQGATLKIVKKSLKIYNF